MPSEAVIDLTGRQLFFRCGHDRSLENSAPKGRQTSGKPAFRCRRCLNAKEAARYRNDPDRRQRSIERKRQQRREQSGPRKRRATMSDRIAELERENELLKAELEATLDALLKERETSKASPAPPSVQD